MPLLMPTNSNRVAAVSKLQKYPGQYLYVARRRSQGRAPPAAHAARTSTSTTGCGKPRGGLKLAHGLMYLTISMTALLAAIWADMWFAGRFVAPIRQLIAAAQQVSRGNLKVALPKRGRATCAGCRPPSTR